MASPAPLGLQGAYAPGQRTVHDELRAHLLEVAGRLLTEQGPDALAVPRVAAEAGCTPTVLYTMFGTREGLAEALYLEGFERCRRRLAQVPPHPDPLEHLSALCAAYREACLAEPGFYGLMFERAVPEFEPSERARTLARAALNAFDRTIAECISAGYLIPAQPREIADALWAAAQGAIGLERAGHLRDGGVYRTVTTAAICCYVAKGAEVSRPG